MSNAIIIGKDFTFEASHVLPRHPGKCSQLHGHSWQLRVNVIGNVNKESGFVMDYGDLKHLVNKHIIEKVDHQHLGQGGASTILHDNAGTQFMPPFGTNFYPSSENLVVAFARILNPIIVEHKARLFSIELRETCTSSALWTAQQDWKGLLP